MYETMGPLLPAPALASLWAASQLFALTRRSDLRRAGVAPDGDALFARLLAHPEGVEVARLDEAENLATHLRHRDGKIRLAPPLLLAELERALAAPPPAADPAYPLVLNGGHRTRWTANTIQRDPAWQKGKGAVCALGMSPADAAALGAVEGELVEVATRRGQVRVPLAVDATLQPGHVIIPNGYGIEYPDARTGELRRNGACINELTDGADRDPLTGCPHHKAIPCRVSRAVTAPDRPAP
jgi:formate dehydrogenase